MTAPRPAVRPMRFLSAAEAAGALLAATACSAAEKGAGPEARTGAGRAERPAAAATGSPSPSPAVLTEEGARRALITEADIEDAWTQVKPSTAQSWRDSLLIGDVDAAQFTSGTTDAADCRRLTDALFDETLLGRPSGASALTGFQEGDSRLLYQVAAYDRKALDDSMRWLKTLPQTCDRFTLSGSGGSGGSGGKRTVEVVETSLPDEGDARQGLTVTVRGDEGGAPVTLTLALAVVRVGDDAITLTQGGVDGARASTTRSAVEQGTQRLEEVLAGRTPSPDPTVFD